ncbi:hypothetical protein [Streptomyces sp. NPDC052042]|uniref:hypothetical protein n=1 Tax=Streptomyces sp. NPDC052042 TaxID=3365683 RepID=UPI0037D93D65
MGILGATAGGRKKDRKKKPDELLSSVVRETAIPAAVELLRENRTFAFPSGTAWVMLVLSADAVGGLSRRHGRDEAKGSIIELIDSDQIRTVATAEMLEEEVVGLIPDEGTLARMEEYSLLTNAVYAWAVVWQKPGGELVVDLVADATFAQAQRVSSGATSLKEAVGAQVWAEHSGVVEAESADGADTAGPDAGLATDADTDTDTGTAGGLDDDDEGDEIFDPIPGDEDDVPEYTGDEPVFEEAPDEFLFDDGTDGPGPEDSTDTDDSGTGVTAAAAVEAETETEPAFDETAGFEEVDGDETDVYGADGPETYPSEDGDEVLLADQEQVRDAIARRFLSEELDLEVRLDEFNATFAIGAPVVQIAVPQGATEWLGDQVAQLNRQANADLAQLRQAHEDELRTLYVTLMSAHVEQVIRDVATDREGSRYKALKDGAEQAHQDRQGQKEQRIREARARIVQDHEAQAKKLAEQAAIQAEIQYKERNRPRMEREQADAVAEIDRVIENTRSHDLQEILRVRRADAQLKMQVGTSRIFEVLAERQAEFLAAEEERLGRWKDEIQRIVGDNRQADIAQANALAEHQRTVDEVGILRREQEDLLESLRNEHADRIRQMEAEFERNRQDAIAQMRARDAEWQHRLDLEQEQTDSATQRNTDLLTQMEALETTIDRRYQKTILDLKSDRDSYSIAMARAAEVQKRSNTVLITLVVALSLLSGAAGFIGGAASGLFG